MYCGKCGRENRDGIHYCIHCGAELATQRPAESVDETFSADPTRAAPRHPSAPATVAIGTWISERYEVLELLGRGGMASVYRVLDHELRHEVALKLMAPELAQDPAALERFRNEARLARLLVHPHIVRTYDIGSWIGQRFSTMEYVAGPDLRAYLDERGALPFPEARRIGLELLEALAYAHRHTIHRDLKPANVLLEGAAHAVRLTDFGIARVAPEFTFQTRTGIAMGTSRYMAPEQWRDASRVDARADLWAVGVLLYEMTTARLPEGRFKLPSALREGLPAGLDDLIERCLAQDPEDRPRNAEEVRLALEALGDVAPATPRRMPDPPPPEAAAPPPPKATAKSVASPMPTLRGDCAVHLVLPPTWAVQNREVAVRVDGHPVGRGTLGAGLELAFEIGVGPHALELALDGADPPQVLPLHLAIPGPHRVELRWVRAAARFSRTLRVREPAP